MYQVHDKWCCSNMLSKLSWWFHNDTSKLYANFIFYSCQIHTYYFTMLLIIAQPQTQPQPPLSLTNVQLFGGTLYYTMVLYSLSLSTLYSLSRDHHLLPRPTERNDLLGPNKRYWAEILGISSKSPNLIFESVLVYLIGSSN